MYKIQFHKQFLSKLCRVCGEQVVLKVGYRTAVLASKYAPILEEKYGVLTGMEDELQYPKTLCVCCSKKLYKLSSKSVSTDLVGHLPAAEFPLHNDTFCSICSKGSNHLNKSELNIKSLDESMKSIGFDRIACANVKRVYVHQSFDHCMQKVTTEISFMVNFDNTQPSSQLKN